MRREEQLADELRTFAEARNPKMPESERRKLDQAVEVLLRMAAGQYDRKDPTT